MPSVRCLIYRRDLDVSSRKIRRHDVVRPRYWSYPSANWIAGLRTFNLLKARKILRALALGSDASGDKPEEKKQVRRSNHPELDANWCEQQRRHEVHECRQSKEDEE